MKFTHSATIPFAADEIDLGEWLFTMSDREYQAVARQHRGLGTFVESGTRGMINVEAIGHVFIVQHYHEVHVDKSLVQLFSERSLAYLIHVLPVSLQVRWTMSITPGTAGESIFSCTVDTRMPTFLRLMAWATGVRGSLRRHTVEETEGFAADITRKLRARVTRAAAAAA